MIRLVIGLCLLFLGLGMATVLLVHAVRRKRAAAKLRRPFATKQHAGTESLYWQTKCQPDATKAITRTSGRLPEPEVVYHEADYFWMSAPAKVRETLGDYRPREEWAPRHPLAWRVVKVDAIYYAVSSKCPAEVQRYSPTMLGWVKEEDLGAWGEAVWASIQMPMGQA